MSILEGLLNTDTPSNCDGGGHLQNTWLFAIEREVKDFEGFQPYIPHSTLKVPRLYRNRKSLRVEAREDIQIQCITFLENFVVVGTACGKIRFLHPSTLTFCGESPLGDSILDFIETDDHTMILVVCRTALYLYNSLVHEADHIPGEGPYLKGFRTLNGTFVVGEDGYLYELIRGTNLYIDCHKICRLTTSIQSAATVSNKRADPLMGILLVVGCCDRVAIFRIFKDGGDTLSVNLVHTFELDMEGVYSFKGPMILCASDEHLFVADKSDRYVKNETEASIWAFDWNAFFQRTEIPTELKLPGRLIMGMSADDDQVTVSLVEQRIVIYETFLLSRNFIFECNETPEVVRFINGHLILSSQQNTITSYKPPQNKAVCRACRQMFLKPPLTDSRSCVCTPVCKHRFP